MVLTEMVLFSLCRKLAALEPLAKQQQARQELPEALPFLREVAALEETLLKAPEAMAAMEGCFLEVLEVVQAVMRQLVMAEIMEAQEARLVSADQVRALAVEEETPEERDIWFQRVMVLVV
tara:strand:+ start:432 stop:794 length:363 start_codon:yes stop_codon:yes gene_type:complete